MSVHPIQLRGVRVHNLQDIDVDIPRHQLVVICGVSGSGKTSLALDTLYAEGQRRYIESFSPYTRQFLDQFDKPDADKIEGIPPAIAVTRRATSRSSRSTVGTATEVIDYLRLLFAKVGRVCCRSCGQEVLADTAERVAQHVLEFPAGRRFLLAFPCPLPDKDRTGELAQDLREDGFVRAVVGSRIVDLSADEPLVAACRAGREPAEVQVVVDRLVAGKCRPQRVRDSVEIAFAKGGGRCAVLAQGTDATASDNGCRTIEGAVWQNYAFSDAFRCESCGIDYAIPSPELLSFNSPLGACPECKGFGNIMDIDMDLVVPDPGKSLRDGAIAPWNTPAYAHELEELLALADDYGLPVDVPFRELTDEHRALIQNGVPQRDFGGLRGFFRWLERRKYKMHLRVFLSRWRTQRTCATCRGQRLRPEALAVELDGHHLGQVGRLEIRHARKFFQRLPLSAEQQTVARTMLAQIESRLDYLEAVGLGYLTLDRTIRTLSGGEAQRVALTSALGSSLVNLLYVLDEPSVGLHPHDVGRLIRAIRDLRDRHNTVVVVEHEESMLREADQLIEIGPGAGERGGRIVFQGPLEQMEQAESSLTGDYLFGRRGLSVPHRRRAPNHGWIRLQGARGNNLQDLTVAFPMGVLCLVTGVSGSGKSTLVQDTLYGALCRRKRKTAPKPYPYEDIFGDGQIDDVILVDQSPIGRSPRSNPVTYIKAFDRIRAVFADTIDARTHNYSASHFSFNVDGGRCTACRGDGFKAIDMQFLADVYMTCQQCGGTRYRPEILEVTYRGRNIADVLNLTAREAFSFFRGQTKVQARLKRLLDVGLDYLRLGQPATTLSAGEAQRLKLASHMSAATRSRTLFILDEPTTGLHFSDVVQLLDCFDALLSVGHSLIVVEHNLQMIKAADYLIDLGPGAADDGGRVVAAGTPEEVAGHPDSATGAYLAEWLNHHQQPAESDPDG